MRRHDRSRLAWLLAAPLGAAVLLLLTTAAFAQGGPGLFVRDTCTALTVPNGVEGKTWCFNATTRAVMVWHSGAFIDAGGTITGTGTQGTPAAWSSSTTIAAGGAYKDVTQFGTWGGTAAQNRAAIQAAIDSLPSTGGTVALPTGSFLIDCSTTISVIKPVRVVGQGRSATSLVATCAATPIFTVTTALSVKFEHLSLSTNVSRTTGGYGIRLAGAGGTDNQNSYINNVQFDQQDVGLYCASCSTMVVVASYFSNNTLGLFIDNTDTPDAGDSKVMGCTFLSGSTNTHIFQQASGGLALVGNKFNDGQNGYTVNIRNGVDTSIALVTGNSFENFSDHGIVFTTTGSGSFSNFTIAGNEFRPVGSSGTPISLDAVSAAALSHGTIASNILFLDQANTRGIEIIHAQDVLVTGNTIDCGSSSGTSAIYIDALASRPTVGPNKTNNCAIAVENNGVLTASLSGPLGVTPLSTSAGGTGQIDLYELRANGTNTVTIAAPDSMGANWKMTLPTDGGTSGYCLVTDGNGVTSWSNTCAGGGGGGITSLGGQVGPVITTVDDTNVTLSWAANTGTLGWNGQLSVARGGTGLGSGTSGGIPAYTGATTITSSGVLTNHALVIGGGAGAVPKTIAALTNGQLAIGSTGADPVPATLTAGTGISVTNGAGSITIANTGPTGTGAAGRIAFWTGASTFSSDADFLYDSTNHIQTITTNASTLQAPPTNTRMVVASASASNSDYLADGYAGQGGLVFRRANGTPAAPTALALDNPIGAVQGLGYSGAAYTTVRASLGFFAKQNWTGSNQGTYMTFGLTPSNTTTFDEYMRLDADLGLRVRGPEPWADVTAFGNKVCTGLTDSTDNDAINAAISSGASVIRFPVGTCNITTITPVTGQTFVGAGRSVTILKRISGTADMIAVGRNTTSLRFTDMAIDGNNLDGNGLVIGDGVAGSFDTNTSILLVRMKFQNFAASSSSTKAMLFANASRKIVAIFDSIFTGGSVGIRFVDTSPPLYVSRTVVQTAANAGMLGSGTGFGALIFGSWFFSNRDGIVSSINQLHVLHSYIENSTRNGVDFTGGMPGGAGDLRIENSFVTCPGSGTSTILKLTNDPTPVNITMNTLVGGNASCTPISFTSFPGSPTFSAVVAGNKLDNTFAAFTIPSSIVAYGNTQSGAGGNFFVLNPQTISLNGSAGPSLFGSGITLNILQADATSNRLQMISAGVGTAPGFDLGKAKGTLASPTTLTAGETIFVNAGYGYDGSSWTAATGGYRLQASETWNGSAHGTTNEIIGTVNGTTTLVSEITVGGAGGVQIGAPSGGGKGVGTVNAAGRYYANGSQGVSCAPGTVNIGTITIVNGIVTGC